jgi:hypothetical protein
MVRSSASVPIRFVTVLALTAAMLALVATAAAHSLPDDVTRAVAQVGDRSAAAQRDRKVGISLFQIERCLDDERKGDPASPTTAGRSHGASASDGIADRPSESMREVTLPPTMVPEDGVRCPIGAIDT